MADVLHVFDLLDDKVPKAKSGIFVTFGTEWFLRYQAIGRLVKHAEVDGAAIKSRQGEETSWRDVFDDLATRSLFDEGGHRLTVVRSADTFVTKHRPQLESLATSIPDNATLILEVDTFVATTKLYKLVLEHGVVVRCAPPIKGRTKDTIDEKAVQAWLVKRGKNFHQVQLTTPQANLILDRVGFVFGMLDAELAKLALFADSNGNVTDAIVHELVGGWRTKTVWEIADQIADGKLASAMEHLDRLFASGQNAFGVFAQLSWYFRRFGLAMCSIEQSERRGQRPVIADALEQAGFHRYNIADAEQKLRRIGRARARELLTWLRELDLQMKGTHSQDDRGRLALEAFVFRFA